MTHTLLFLQMLLALVLPPTFVAYWSDGSDNEWGICFPKHGPTPAPAPCTSPNLDTSPYFTWQLGTASAEQCLQKKLSLTGQLGHVTAEQAMTHTLLFLQMLLALVLPPTFVAYWSDGSDNEWGICFPKHRPTPAPAPCTSPNLDTSPYFTWQLGTASAEQCLQKKLSLTGQLGHVTAEQAMTHTLLFLQMLLALALPPTFVAYCSDGSDNEWGICFPKHRPTPAPAPCTSPNLDTSPYFTWQLGTASAEQCLQKKLSLTGQLGHVTAEQAMTHTLLFLQMLLALVLPPTFVAYWSDGSDNEWGICFPKHRPTPAPAPCTSPNLDTSPYFTWQLGTASAEQCLQKKLSLTGQLGHVTAEQAMTHTLLFLQMLLALVLPPTFVAYWSDGSDNEWGICFPKHRPTPAPAPCTSPNLDTSPYFTWQLGTASAEQCLQKKLSLTGQLGHVTAEQAMTHTLLFLQMLLALVLPPTFVAYWSDGSDNEWGICFPKHRPTPAPAPCTSPNLDTSPYFTWQLGTASAEQCLQKKLSLTGQLGHVTAEQAMTHTLLFLQMLLALVLPPTFVAYWSDGSDNEWGICFPKHGPTPAPAPCTSPNLDTSPYFTWQLGTASAEQCLQKKLSLTGQLGHVTAEQAMTHTLLFLQMLLALVLPPTFVAYWSDGSDNEWGICFPKHRPTPAPAPCTSPNLDTSPYFTWQLGTASAEQCLQKKLSLTGQLGHVTAEQAMTHTLLFLQMLLALVLPPTFVAYWSDGSDNEWGICFPKHRPTPAPAPCTSPNLDTSPYFTWQLGTASAEQCLQKELSLTGQLGHVTAEQAMTHTLLFLQMLLALVLPPTFVAYWSDGSDNEWGICFAKHRPTPAPAPCTSPNLDTSLYFTWQPGTASAEQCLQKKLSLTGQLGHVTAEQAMTHTLLFLQMLLALVLPPTFVAYWSDGSDNDGSDNECTSVGLQYARGMREDDEAKRAPPSDEVGRKQKHVRAFDG
ncbi:uncharacterized protein ISCGN_026816 [Ixodes scapularis]